MGTVTGIAAIVIADTAIVASVGDVPTGRGVARPTGAGAEPTIAVACAITAAVDVDVPLRHIEPAA